MNKVIELAREAGAYDAGHNYFGMGAVTLEKFYALARADLEAECERRKTQFASAEFAVNELKAENAKLREALEHCMNILEIEVSRGLRMNLPAQH